MIDQDLIDAVRQYGQRVVVPPFPASEVLTAGHRIRRRRTVAASTGGVAAVAIVAFLVPSIVGNHTKTDHRQVPPLDGISASESPSSSARPHGSNTTITDPASVVLPIDSYEQTQQQVSAQQRAEYLLRSQCLTRFALTLAPPEITDPNVGGGPNTRLYGIPGSLEIARTYGFHFVSDGTHTGGNSSLTPDQTDVLFGRVSTFHGKTVPSGGCVMQTDRTMNAAAPLATNPVAAAIDGDSYTSSLTDPRVVAAQARWSTCMKTMGYSYTTTFTAVVDTGDRASAHEIAIAVASWTCAARVRLLETWVNVQSAYQNHQIALHASALASERSQIAVRAAYVQQVLNSQPAQ